MNSRNDIAELDFCIFICNLRNRDNLSVIAAIDAESVISRSDPMKVLDIAIAYPIICNGKGGLPV